MLKITDFIFSVMYHSEENDLFTYSVAMKAMNLESWKHAISSELDSSRKTWCL